MQCEEQMWATLHKLMVHCIFVYLPLSFRSQKLCMIGTREGQLRAGAIVLSGVSSRQSPNGLPQRVVAGARGASCTTLAAMQNRFRWDVFGTSCGCLMLMASAGCEKEAPQQDAVSQDPQTPSAVSPGLPAPQSARAKEAAGATPVVDCPAGKYLFDYSSYNLQTLLDPGDQGMMKVVKQAGTAQCTISAPALGTWSCTINEPMVAEISMNQMGLSATGKVEMTGTAALTYVADAPGSLQVKSTDVSAYKMKASMNLGGKEIPFPMDHMPQLFGNEGTRWHYACTGESLHLKGEVPGNATVELSMKRL